MDDRKITLCLGCMRRKGEEEICPHCGYKYTPEPQGKYLLPKTVLNERYVVGRVISTDSDGVTYIGFDVQIESRVEIKEFFPESMVSRGEGAEVVPQNGREVLFKTLKSELSDLYGKLRKIKTVNCIPTVFDIFEANGTVYTVSERKELIKFSDYLTFEKNTLTWDKFSEMIMPLFLGVATLNEMGIFHRRISPSTVFVDKYGKMSLQGFGVETLSAVGYEKGYAPPEYYIQNSETGFFSEVYSLGAIMYKALTGVDPVSATDRMSGTELPTPRSINPDIEERISKIIMKAMSSDSTERIQSARGLYEILNSTANAIPDIKETEKEKENKTNKTIIIVSVIAAIVAIALVIGIALMLFKPKGPDVIKPSENSVLRSENSEDNDDVINAVSEISSSSDGRYYATPGLKGKKYSELSPDYLKRFSFDVTYEYNDEYSEGIIVSQSPEEDKPLPLMGTIKVVVSKGRQFYDIPEYEDADIDDYIAGLYDLGYTEENIIAAEIQGTFFERAGKVSAVFLENGEKQINVEDYSPVYVIYYAKGNKN